MIDLTKHDETDLKQLSPIKVFFSSWESKSDLPMPPP